MLMRLHELLDLGVLLEMAYTQKKAEALLRDWKSRSTTTC